MAAERLEIRCPICGFPAVADTEEDLKKELMQHSQSAHKMKRPDFENMYSELMMVKRLFAPSKGC